MRRGLLIVLCLGAACAGLDRETETQIAKARKLIATEPLEALFLLDPLLVRHPENLEACWLRAESLAALGRAEPASDAWKAILDGDLGLSDAEEIDAHRNFATQTILALGSLPHRVTTAPETARSARLDAALQSFAVILSRLPEDDGAKIGTATCLYIFSRHDDARSTIDQLSAAGAATQPAQFLRALLLEQPSGFDPHAFDILKSLVRNSTAGVFTPAAEHLIYLAESNVVPGDYKREVQGELLRLGRQADAPRAVVDWLQRYEISQSQRLPALLAQRQFEDVDTAQRLKTWAKGWSILEEMPARIPEVLERRRSFVAAWAGDLFDAAQQRLAANDMEGVRQILAGLQALPGTELTPALLAKQKEIAEKLRLVEVTSRARQRFTEAEVALKRRRAPDALAALSGLEQEIPAELRPQLFLLRARGLLMWGDRKGALSAFDECRSLLEITDKRQYAVLLAEAGRAEEATDYLELLPLGALQGDTFSALLSALERQGRWESILSRLADIDPLPEAYQPMLTRATLEAAQRRVRLGDPARALEILRTHLRPQHLTKAPAFAVHLQALIEARDLDAAAGLVLGADRATFLTLNHGQVLTALDELAGRISDEKRFELLTLLRSETDDPEIEDTIVKLLPRFATYLPEAGNYSARLRYQAFAGEGIEEGARNVLAELVWEQDHFVVTGEGLPREEWWVEEGVWHRLGNQGDLLIPVRIEKDGTLPTQTFERGQSEWRASILEAGVRVQIASKSYEGCLRIRVGPANSKTDYTEIVVAPKMGEILCTGFVNGRKTFTQELQELVRK